MFLQERAFVTDAERQLQLLIEAAQLPDQLGCARALTTVKACAKTVSARGVIAAAKVCEHNLSAQPYTPEVMLRSVATLQHLVGQYRNGLEEIDPEFVTASQTDISRDLTEDSVSDETFETLEADITIGAAPTAEAKEILNSLLPFAREDEAAQLKVLMCLSGGETVERFGLETPQVPMPNRSVLAETIMTPVTNSVLAAAHRFGKSVSLSYAVGECRLSANEAQTLQMGLTALCVAAVEQGQGTAIARRREGLPATAQISITATPATRQTGQRFELSGDGIAALELGTDILEDAAWPHLQVMKNGRGLTVEVSEATMSGSLSEPLEEPTDLTQAFDVNLAGETYHGALA